MKSFLLLALVFGTFSAHAGEEVIYAAQIHSASHNADVDTSFQMDRTTGEGNVRVVVSDVIYERNPFPGPMNCDQWGRCYPGNYRPMPRTITLLNETVRVQGLNLDGDKVMFESSTGPVHCGTMGVTRVFKRPAIFLSGNCKLVGRISHNGSVVVKMMTK